jgi:uncharacterized metal-binding protein
MDQKSCAADGNMMLLACSGGSNVGQLANRVAVELTDEGFGKMYCLAGIGALLKNFVQSAKDAKNIVAIDGCALGCVRAVLENAEIPLQQYLVLTDLGIEKNKDFDLKNDDINRVKESVKKVCGQ